MALNIKKLYQDFNIHWASPGERHFGDGWINTPCPFCTGNPGNHLGFCEDLSSKYFGVFVCHRCGGHAVIPVIAKLLRMSNEQAKQIIDQYGGRLPSRRVARAKPVPILRIKTIELPQNTKQLNQVAGALNYVKKRGFDPEELATLWKVQATGPLALVYYQNAAGKERKLDLSYRIIVPIYYQGQLVSWQGRDWTGKSEVKYLTCPPELEGMFHKDLLYGLDLAEGLDTVNLVEGVWDVWRIGPGTVASFGIKFSSKQVQILKEFPVVNIFYDPEPQAQLQARKLCAALQQYKCQVRNISTHSKKDPAETSRDENVRLIKGNKNLDGEKTE